MPRVGLEVHAHQTHLCALDLATGEVERKRIEGPPEAALARLEDIGAELIAVYEAGPTGFGLARAGAERGLDVRVAAPDLIPRAPSDRVKTDRRDAERLARLLAAGELRFVHVPTIAEEHFRDLLRCREDLRGDQMRARHRLSKFLMRHSIRYPGRGRNWTENHRKWLGRLSFDDRATEATFVDYLSAVESLGQRPGFLDQTIAELVPESSHAELIARLRCFRGIDTLSAAGICAEVGDFSRFAKPKLLARFLGITPSERTSDEKRRQGGITKAGSKHARRLPVEAAHHYARQPKVSGDLRRRQDGQDARLLRLGGHDDRLRAPSRRPRHCRGVDEQHEGQARPARACDERYGQPVSGGARC